MKKVILFACLFFWLLKMLPAQILSTAVLTASIRQYEKSVWNIQLKAAWENPYLQEDISLEMQFISPVHIKLVLPCYYESGSSGLASTWRARFSPQESGTYQYRFILLKTGVAIDSTEYKSFVSKPSGKDGILHVKNNWVFEFDNGKPFRGIGENIGWESRSNDDSRFFKALHENKKYSYELMLPELAGHGANYFRTWVCSWNLPIDWKKGFNNSRYLTTPEFYNPSAINKLDSLVDLCDSLHLHMMLTLGPGAYHQRDGGFAQSAADFFVNSQSKALYKNRLRYFVARWGYSSAIGAWEFFNEVDNVQFSNRTNPINPQDIVQWHEEMSTYLKNLDPYKHVVTTSISHRDIKGLNSVAGIDINQKHIYKNTESIPMQIVQYNENFKKPYVIGEYSYEWDWSKDFNLFAKEMDSDFKRGLWYGLFSPTPILPLSWWWEFFEDRGTDHYFNRIRNISDRMLKAGGGTFEEVGFTDSTAGVKTMAVRCGKQLFIYVYNSNATPKTISLGLKSFGIKVKGTRYDPESEKWSSLSGIQKKSNQLLIKEVSLNAVSDAVLIIGEETR